jgi:programmed cell death 6-interacting protein
MLALPFKLPDKAVDWPGALDKYVRRTYSKGQAEAHAAQFSAVAETRRAAVSHPPTETTADEIRQSLVRYHRLLVALEGRFDMSQLRLTFVWRDAFKPSVKQGEADSRFERAAVLFNLAAVLSFDATVQKRSEADGIKQACQHFQLAAGLLHQLWQLVADAPWASEAASSGDLCPHSIDAMKTLMLAQAQRCFYEKAVLDGLSPKLLSLVASQAAIYYGLAADMLRADRMAARVDASWANVIGGPFDSLFTPRTLPRGMPNPSAEARLKPPSTHSTFHTPPARSRMAARVDASWANVIGKYSDSPLILAQTLAHSTLQEDVNFKR